jgi:hypothetical protein
MSNKECCVMFLQNPDGIKMIESMPGILAHEYAHHFQVANAGFPFYFFRSKYETGEPPSFVKPYEIGSLVKEALLDNVRLPEGTVIEDSLERIGDIICEGILRERRIPSAIEDLYKMDVTGPDPPLILKKEILKRYVYRLVLRDLAEWGALIQLALPQIASTLAHIGKEKAHRLNKNHLNANQAYEAVFNLCLETDFNSFRKPTNMIAYTHKVFNILKIKLKPPLA